MDSAEPDAMPTAGVAELLLMADSLAHCEALLPMLRSHVVQSVIVDGDTDVLGATSRHAPRLIVIFDAGCAAANAPTLCSRLKDHPRHGELPILLLAGLASSAELARALECRADEFLPWPCDGALLEARITMLLGERDDHARWNAEHLSIRGFEHHRHARRTSRLAILDTLQAAHQRAQQADARLNQRLDAFDEANRFLEVLFEHLPDMVFVKDCEQLRFTRINAAGEQIVGRARDEILGRRAEQLFAPDEAAMMTATDREAVTRGTLVNVAEECVRSSDGSLRTLHTRKRVLCDAEGNPRFLLGVSKDITDRKRASQALLDAKRQLELSNETLARREEELQSVVDFMADCVITIDERGIVQGANPVVSTVFGWSVEEVVGNNVSMLMPEPTCARHDGYLLRYLRGGEPGVIGKRRMVEGLRKDGSSVMIELAVSEYQVHGKRFYTGIVRDVGERVRMLNELEIARIEAERANRAKSEFLATMSHEIRTPMNGVIGMIEVLQQSSLKGYQVEMVDLIRDSAFSLLTLIDRILDFSKLEAGALEVEHTSMALGAVIEAVCGMLDHLAARKGVDLVFFVDPAIPSLVLGDALRVRQVLLNLVGNAIKFSSEPAHHGEVAVRAELVARNGGELTVELRVIDNGIGMDAGTQARLFAPFSQADASTTRRFGGTGLGLAICHRLVSLMHGSISVESDEGIGSTFIVTLPFASDDDRVPAPQADSDVKNLRCVVLGGDHGLAADHQRYLVAAGAFTLRHATLDELTPEDAQRFTSDDGPLVCVMDAGHGASTPREVLQALQDRLGTMVRLVMVERGKRRQARQLDTDLIVVDGNVLSRATLLRVVAVAGGRAAMDPEARAMDKSKQTVCAPSREQAQRDGRLILVAEDNDINQKVILRQLGLLGFTADVAANGREALEAWQQQSYALLLTDLHMPEMDGYDLTRAIRKLEAGSVHRPIIALTANALREEVETCRAVGMDDYLSKPALLDALRAMLEKWLPASTPVDTPAAMSLPSVPIDAQALRALAGDDEELIHELLREFRVSARAQVALLDAACRRADGVESVFVAHKLKSAARAIGAHAFADLCAEIERDGGTADAAALGGFATRVRHDFMVIEAALASRATTDGVDADVAP